MSILRKIIGFCVMYWGIAWWVAGAAAFFVMLGDPGFTVWTGIGIVLLAGILGFVCFYTGRWIWKGDKKPRSGIQHPQVFNPAAGGAFHGAFQGMSPGTTHGSSHVTSHVTHGTTHVTTRITGNGTTHVTTHSTTTGDPELAKELNELLDEMNDLFSKTFNQPGIPAGGSQVHFDARSSGVNRAPGATENAVTVQCPGCGAPVTVSPSASGECEYCGSQVPYKRSL